LSEIAYGAFRVVDVLDVESVEGHESDLARQLLPVHLFEDLGADLVRVDDVVEEPVSVRDTCRAKPFSSFHSVKRTSGRTCFSQSKFSMTGP